MKQFFTLLFFLPIFLFGQGSMELQDKQLNINLPRQVQIDSFLSTSPQYAKLTKEEKELFYWVNLLRFDPPLFEKEVLIPFLQQFPETVSSYSKSLSKELQSQEPLQLVSPDKLLAELSAEQARDIVYKQKGISHNSSDGRNFQQRMQNAGITRCAGENIFEGGKDALQAIIILLIDQGVPGVGHRKALLNPAFNMMGSAFEPKKSGPNIILVQIFSCK